MHSPSPSDGMFDFVTNSFQQSTVIWILISVGLGGLISQVIKFIFEQTVPQLQRRRASRIARRKYSYPLYHAASELLKVLEENFLSLDRNRRYSKDSYLNVKILYGFGSFFGWGRIFLRESFSEYSELKKGVKEEEEKKAARGRWKSFDTHFYNAMYCMSDDWFFSHMKEEEMSLSEIESATIPRHVTNIIGDLMIKEAKFEDKTTFDVISFIEFMQKYEANAEYKKWFCYIDKLLCKLGPSDLNARWNRLVIFCAFLGLLRYYLWKRERVIYKSILIAAVEYLREKVFVPVWEKIQEAHRYVKSLGNKSGRDSKQKDPYSAVGYMKHPKYYFYDMLPRIENKDYIEVLIPRPLRSHAFFSDFYVDSPYVPLGNLEKLHPTVLGNLRFSLQLLGYLGKVDKSNLQELSQDRKELKRQPEYSFRWEYVGNTLYKLTRYGEAVDYYDKAKELENDSSYWSGAQAHKCFVLCRIGEFRKAIECCEKAIERFGKPTHGNVEKIAELWYSKGLSHCNLFQYEKAIECFDQVLIMTNPGHDSLTQQQKDELSNYHLYAWHNKGATLRKLGKPDEGEKCFNEVEIFIRNRMSEFEVWRHT